MYIGLQNIDVELENKEAVQRGTARYLVYVASHPSCVDGLRVTRMVFNNRLLCENEPYKGNKNVFIVLYLTFLGSFCSEY